MNSMGRFNWDDMQFFLALARSGQLTAAARQLGSSHVTVARRIDRLERDLRQRLFERSARGYELTAQGRRLVASAEHMENATTDTAPGSPAGHGLAGRLRIAAPEGFSSFFAERMLPPFLARFPDMSLDLIALTQVLSLSRREADLTITLGSAERGSYRSEHLADYGLRIYGSRDYLAQHPPIAASDDLPAHRFLGYIEETLFSHSLDYLSDIHPVIRPVFKSSSIFNQLAATRQGSGLCVLPCYLAAPFPELVPVLPRQIKLTRSYWITCHADTRQLRRERALVAFLTEQIAGHSRDLLEEDTVSL
jgi:DNA-binding transcriptional LysR family regulator